MKIFEPIVIKKGGTIRPEMVRKELLKGIQSLETIKKLAHKGIIQAKADLRRLDKKEGKKPKK